MAPKSSARSSASEGEGRESVKGEKSKIKKKTTPPATPNVDGATGGCVGEESSTDDQGDSGPRSCFTMESMNKLCRHLGDGRGECVVVVLLLVFYCFAGVNRCKLFKGQCCSLVNDVINILIEYGEIDPNAEVNIIV